MASPGVPREEGFAPPRLPVISPAMRRNLNRVGLLAVTLCLLFPRGEASAFEFDQRARKMGLNGIAWNATFTIYATDNALAADTLAHTREAYSRILSQLNQRQLRRKCLVFVWRDRQQYVLHAGMFAANRIRHTEAFVMRDFWRDYHALFAYESDNLYGRVLPHELAHLVLPVFLDPTRKVTIPLWLNEGFAQYQEEGSLAQAVITVGRAAQKQALFPLRELMGIEKYPDSYGKKRIFYDQSELLVRFLIENQEKKGDFFAFVYALSCSGRSVESALKSCYPQWPGVAALERAFRDYVSLIFRNSGAARRRELREAAAASPGEEEGGGTVKPSLRPESSLRFDIGDPEPKFIQLLGRPLQRHARLFYLEERKIYLGDKRKVRRKKTITDKLRAFQIVYPGLSVVISNGRALCISASAPFEGRVGGVAVGDSATSVIMRHGKPDYMKESAGGYLMVYEKRGGKSVYKVVVENGKVSMITAYRSRYKGIRMNFW